MEALTVELVLIVDDEVVGTVGKGYDGGMGETPPETSGHGDSEGKLVVLWGELGNVKPMGVQAGNLP